MAAVLQKFPKSKFIDFMLNGNPYVRASAIIITCLYVACGAISKSYVMGRFAFPMTHNDVNYLIDGVHRLVYVELNGFWAELAHLYSAPLHAPLAAYQAALGFYLFGFHDWAPYVTNIVYLLIFASVCIWSLRGMPMLVVIAALLAIAGMQISYTTISEFAPETPCGLFSAIGVILLIRIDMLDRALGPRALAGLCLGLSLLAKPSSFIFMPLVLCATLGVAFIRDIVMGRQWRRFGTAITLGLLQIVLSLWLPSLYLIPNFHEYLSYFELAMFDQANVTAFGGSTHMFADVTYYLTGQGAEYMFGNFLWAYVLFIALGVATAIWRGDRRFLNRIFELSPLVAFIWLMPSAAKSQNTLFGMPFGYVLLYMVVISFVPIYEALKGRWPAILVPVFGFVLFVSGVSRTTLPNTPGFDWYAPGAHVIREELPPAMARFRDVMLSNTTNYADGSVFLTNGGYYHTPVLKYSFLKKDPFLNWAFDSLWWDSNPQDHMNYIRDHKVDYVIAAEPDNGLTFAPTLIAGAAGSEEATLAAMWKNPDYAPIDRFYGPTGGMITVFQRRGSFCGWRPLGGFAAAGPRWVKEGLVSHLQAYAPEAIAANLVIEASGSAGQKVEILLNRDRVGELRFDAGGNASASWPITLSSGQNDVILHYPSSDEKVSFERLQILRDIKPTE